MSVPQVSVVMAVYNASHYIEKALYSIETQTYRNIEFIIVQDPCTDDTEKIIESYKKTASISVTHIINDIRLGISRSLNLGIALSKGDLIARMDADDISLPERIDEQVKYLKKHPDIGILGSNAFLIDEKGNYIASYVLPENHCEIKLHMLLGRPAMMHSPLMIRKKAIFNAGNYDENELCEDIDIIYRILRTNYAHNLSTPLLLYRRQNNCLSITLSDKTKQRYIALLARELSLLCPEFSDCFDTAVKLFHFDERFINTGPRYENIEGFSIFLHLVRNLYSLPHFENLGDELDSACNKIIFHMISACKLHEFNLPDLLKRETSIASPNVVNLHDYKLFSGIIGYIRHRSLKERLVWRIEKIFDNPLWLIKHDLKSLLTYFKIQKPIE